MHKFRANYEKVRFGNKRGLVILNQLLGSPFWYQSGYSQKLNMRPGKIKTELLREIYYFKYPGNT